MKKFLFFSDYWKKIDEQMQVISQLAGGSGEVRRELFSTLENLQSETGGKILLLFMEVCLLFVSRLLSILLLRAAVGENERFNRERMFKIDHYIQTHFDRSISVKAVADLIGMSKGYFFRFFKSANSCSFVEYLTAKRLDGAARMLKETDLKIIEICDKCGFSSHIQFNRAFRKAMKMTPSEYREMETANGEKTRQS
jgi:AraC-like DNA-binding protein